MQASIQGLDTSTGAWAPDGSLYVGSSGTHLRQFDPVDVRADPRHHRAEDRHRRNTAVQRRWGVRRRARDESSDVDGLSSSVARVDLDDGHVAWTLDPDEFDRNACVAFTFSVPEDRLWCADYTGVIRGRSLSTGELDGTTVEHQRSGLSEHRRAVRRRPPLPRRLRSAIGLRRPLADRRWRTDRPQRRRWVRRRRVQPDGRRLLVCAASDGWPGYTAAVWDAVDDRAVLTQPADLAFAGWLDGDRLGAVTADGHGRIVDVRTGATREVPIVVEPGWVQTIASRRRTDRVRLRRTATSTCSTSTRGDRSTTLRRSDDVERRRCERGRRDDGTVG